MNWVRVCEHQASYLRRCRTWMLASADSPSSSWRIRGRRLFRWLQSQHWRWQWLQLKCCILPKQNKHRKKMQMYANFERAPVRWLCSRSPREICILLAAVERWLWWIECFPQIKAAASIGRVPFERKGYKTRAGRGNAFWTLTERANGSSVGQMKL